MPEQKMNLDKSCCLQKWYRFWVKGNYCSCSNKFIFWQIGIALAATSGALFCGNNAIAQIIPDRTLGSESSVVTPNIEIKGITSDRIDGGAIRGSGLFHSFQEFNVTQGRGAYFSNPVGIENIFSRVTGTNPSNIFGTIGVLGNANLFVLNPNGIIFGPNAKLDLGGSFFGSTANSLNFEDGKFFSATNPNAPPLLTIKVPLGVQFGSNPGSIQVQGSIPPQVNDLQGNDGKTLALIGGNVSINDRKLVVRGGGNIELGGLAEAGTLLLNIDSNGKLLSWSFPDGVARANVLLKNGTVDVLSNSDGSIAINAKNIDILGGRLSAGIASNSGFSGAKAGNISLNATGTITLSETSLITNQVDPNGIGNGGNIDILTDSLFLNSGSQVLTNSNTSAQVNAGQVNINARNTIALDGTNINGNPSSILTGVGENGVGNGGDINIITGSLQLSGGAQFNTLTNGQGRAGNVTIQASNTITLDGVSSRGNASSILTGVETNGVGNGGDINITTGSLQLRGGAQLSSLTNGQGRAGKVSIQARNTITLDGVSSRGNASSVLTGVDLNGKNNGNDIDITTDSLSLTGGANLNTLTNGQGTAGNVSIQARTITLDGTSEKGNASSIFSSVDENGKNDSDRGGGDINITTDSLSLTRGASLNTLTNGQGKAGNVIIQARTITLDGRSEKGNSSAISSSVDKKGVGNGGDINITTDSLSLTEGASLNTNTAGQGKAGNINILARERVSLAGGGSEITSGVERQAKGEGGVITINTGLLSLKNNTVVSVNSDREDRPGSAGDINVFSRSIVLDNKAEIRARTNSGEGGNIKLNIGELLALRRGSQISTTAGVANAPGNGGNITLDALNGFIIAAFFENSDITANAFTGSGGRVNINALGIVNMEERSREDLVRLFRTDDPDQLKQKLQNLVSNDITAISLTNPDLSGVINLNAPNVDPTRGTIQLPEDLGDSSRLIAQSCPVGVQGAASRFVVTGRGGLPPNPGSALSTDTFLGSAANASFSGNATASTSIPPQEAQGVVIGLGGEILLTARPSTVTPHTPWQRLTGCNGK